MSEWLLLFVAALIVCFRVYCVSRLWNHPLDHGPGFFLGNEVPAGFYEGAGARWLRRYRSVVLAEHAVEAAVLAALLASGRRELVPVWAGGGAVLFMAMMLGFSAYAGRALGAYRPTAGRIAIALEPRRLGRYISWPAEAGVFAIVAASWLLLARENGWHAPAVMTYGILGLLPVKFLAVRAGAPLPADHIAEHHRWTEAQRRHSLRVVDGMRWLWLSVLAGYALLHGWPGAQAGPWLSWLVIAIALGLSLYMMGLLVRGTGRLAAMGRTLRPAAGWSGGPRGIAPAGWIWMAAYLGGLAALLLSIRV